MMDTNLVAVCGLYCGACSIYWATQNEDEQKLKDFAEGLTAKTGKDFSIDDVRCDGCLSKWRLDLWCRHCQLRLCNKLQSGKVRCSDCDEFPCSRLIDFKNDGMKHHIEIIENLEHIRRIGIEAWAAYEKKGGPARSAIRFYLGMIQVVLTVKHKGQNSSSRFSK
jgi:hypothetical protein